MTYLHGGKQYIVVQTGSARREQPGALVALTLPSKDLVQALLLAQGGLIALSLILIDEVDNAYDDTYSGAVSAHSLLPPVETIPAFLAWRPMLEVHQRVIAGESHPLARRRTVTARELAEFPWVVSQHDHEVFQSVTATLAEDGASLVYTFDTEAEETGIAPLLKRLGDLGVDFEDLHSSESSLEDIFVRLIHESKEKEKRA